MAAHVVLHRADEARLEVARLREGSENEKDIEEDDSEDDDDDVDIEDDKNEESDNSRGSIGEHIETAAPTQQIPIGHAHDLMHQLRASGQQSSSGGACRLIG